MKNMDTQPNEKSFRYRLDFHYQQAILYLVTLLLYSGIRGTVQYDRLPALGTDPVLYIIILFVLISFSVLTLNKIRGRKLIIRIGKSLSLPTKTSICLILQSTAMPIIAL